MSSLDVKPHTGSAAAGVHPATIRVWDRAVRLGHWSLVAGFLTAWWFTEHIGWLHKGAGYLALAVACARVVWGWVGRGHARFDSFVPRPGVLWRYLGLVLRAREPRHIGHNPAGAMMVLSLLGSMIVIGVTGHLMTTDAFWGNDTVETLHTVTVDLTLGAVTLHVLANLYASWRHHENLVKAMLTGHKPLHPAASNGNHALNTPREAEGQPLAPTSHASRSGSAAYRG